MFYNSLSSVSYLIFFVLSLKRIDLLVPTLLGGHTDMAIPYISLRVKVKLSLCLTKHHAMKAYWGSGGIAPRFLDLGTRWR
jgi:hypothetical protein